MSPPDPHPNSRHNHADAQQLPHGQVQEDEPKLGIRLAKEFGNKPATAVAAEKEGEQGAVRPLSVVGNPRLGLQAPQKYKEQYAFEERLVELRGMPGQWPAIGKNHTPRAGGDAAEQLAVDEIAQTTKKKADGHGDDEQIRCPPKINAVTAAIPVSQEEGPNTAAVE